MSQETPNVENAENAAESAITLLDCHDHLWKYVRDEKPGLKVFYPARETLRLEAEMGAAMVRTLISRGCANDIAMNLSLLTLYDILMLIDDSSSMVYEEGGTRIKTLEKTLRLITSIYDLANPSGLCSSVTEHHHWGGVTRLGTELRKKIIDKFLKEDMRKPLRVIVITDGEAEGEPENRLFDVLVNTMDSLERSDRLDPDCAAFHFARIGNDEGAEDLMKSLATYRRLGSQIHITHLNRDISNESERWAMVASLTIGSIVNYIVKSSKSIEHYRINARPQKDGVEHTIYKSSIASGQHGSRVKTTWKNVRVIGKGAFGLVLLQESDGQPWKELRAVKKLAATNNTDFMAELSTLCELTRHHDLFVELFGWYELQGNVFIAMEYVQFGDMSIIAREERRTHAKTITKQILRALNILHREGICHRDIKPQNILVVSLDPFHIKIADFGASKYLAAEEEFTIVGTPGYMAPELLAMAIVPRKQKGAMYTFAVDLWSLGCVVHEILTFRIPFACPATQHATTAISGFATFNVHTAAGTSRYMPSPGGLDFSLLYRFCEGQAVFPCEDLKNANAAKEQIAFIMGLLVPDPNSRMTASQGLESDWMRTGS